MSSDQQNPRSSEQQYDTIDRVGVRLRRPRAHVRDDRDETVAGRYMQKRPGFQQQTRDALSSRPT
jgi:hypothetical protein